MSRKFKFNLKVFMSITSITASVAHNATNSPTLGLEEFELLDQNTLQEIIIKLISSNIDFSDILIHQDSPIMLRQAKRLIAVASWDVGIEMLRDFFSSLSEDWSTRIASGAFDCAKDLTQFRIRVNCLKF
jgi:twitching motility protein PilT